MISVRIMSVASETLPGWMNHTLPAPRLSLWQTAVCDDGPLRLESSRPQSPSSSQPSPVWGVRSTPGQTERLMGVWDNTQLLEALQGRGWGPQTPSSPPLVQEGMLNPNSAAAKQGELASRQRHASVPLLWAAPKLAHPWLASLSLPGTQSYTLAVSGRKILFFFTPVRWCCTSPCTLCDRCKTELQRSTGFWDSPQSQDHIQWWNATKKSTSVSLAFTKTTNWDFSQDLFSWYCSNMGKDTPAVSINLPFYWSHNYVWKHPDCFQSALY